MEENKADYIKLTEAAESLGTSRPMIYHYAKQRGMKIVRFKMDRYSYMLRSDLETLRHLKETPIGQEEQS